MTPARLGARLRAAALGAVAGVLLAACSDSTGVGHQPDLTGLPDLTVDVATLNSTWEIVDAFVPVGSCTTLEYGVPPGVHRVLAFTATLQNVGDADVYVGDPLVHIDPNGDGDYSDSDGLFEWGSCHQHFHYRHFALYELFPINMDGSLGAPTHAAKISFCLRDDAVVPGAPAYHDWVYHVCGNKTTHGLQGISTGWADVYDRTLAGQYFVLDDPPLPAGDYLLRITVDPPFQREKPTDACPAVDPDGNCRMFLEKSYENNVGEIKVHLDATTTAN